MAFGNLTDQLAILRRHDLTSTEKFVAVVALSFRNSESGRCNPPIVSDDAEKETLCSRSGYTKQCVTKTLASLEAKGVLALKKAIARPSEITFTVNDVYGKRGLPSTTITATVNDVYGKGKQRLPITDKEQIKNRQVLIDDFQPHAQDEVAPIMGGTPNSRDTPKIKGTPNSRDTGTPKNWDLKKEEKKEKSMYAPSVEVAHTSVSSKPAKKDPQGSRFTLEELPDEWYSECRRIQPKVDPAKVFDDFRDYWVAIPGAKGRKSDWLATWRNWCRRLNDKDIQRLARSEYTARRSQFSVNKAAPTFCEPEPQKDNPFRVKRPAKHVTNQERDDAADFFGGLFK